MNTATINKPRIIKERQSNINSELQGLKHEVRVLRSFLVSIVGEDREGKYNPKFVKEILKAAREIPSHSFKGAGLFLSELKRA